MQATASDEVLIWLQTDPQSDELLTLSCHRDTPELPTYGKLSTKKGLANMSGICVESLRSGRSSTVVEGSSSSQWDANTDALSCVCGEAEWMMVAPVAAVNGPRQMGMISARRTHNNGGKCNWQPAESELLSSGWMQLMRLRVSWIYRC